MYRSVETSLWDDPKVRKLTPNGKLLFVYLITNRHAHVSGIYVLPPILAGYDLGISQREMDTLSDTLSGLGLARFDPEKDVVWVVNMFRYQGRGEKNDRSAAAQLSTLHKSFLIHEFCGRYPSVKPFARDTLSDTPSRPRVQEQDKDKDKDKDKEQDKGLSSATPTQAGKPAENGRADDVRAVFDHFAEQARGKPRLTEKRKKLIANHLREGRTVEELCLAIDGLYLSRWHTDTGNLTLEYGLRNDEKIEKGQAIATDERHPDRLGPQLSEASRRSLRAADEFVRRHAND